MLAKNGQMEGYPLEIPPHILKQFNHAFGEDVTRCQFMVGERMDLSDRKLWQILVSAYENNIGPFSIDDDADEDEVESFRHVTWH